MTTAVYLIQGALEEIGQYSPGETITAADEFRAFTLLNQMLASWSNRTLITYFLKRYTTPLVIDKTQYTVGPGGDIDDVRPLRVNQAWLTDIRNNNFSIQILDQYDWNLISNRYINSQVPSALWYDQQLPLGIVNIYPKPIGPDTYTLNFTSYMEFTAFTNPVTDIDFPPGYEDAMMHNLAVRCYPFFGTAPNPYVVELAATSLGILKVNNSRLDLAYMDREIVSRASGSYNIRNDAWGSRGSTG